MGVTLRPVGSLKDYVDGQEQVELAAGPAVAEQLAGLGIPPALVALVKWGQDLLSKDYRSQDGETITMVPMVHGG